jgi:hypothetical protein
MNRPSYCQAFNLWQNKILRAFAVVFVLLALVDGSVWWFGYSQHRDLLQLSADACHLPEKIRAQLLESAERTHQSAPSCSFSLAWRSVIAL